MCDTPSHGSDHLWLIWKESIQNCRCYRADTACGTDGRTNRRTDGRTDRRTDGRSETNIRVKQRMSISSICVPGQLSWFVNKYSICLLMHSLNNWAWTPAQSKLHKAVSVAIIQLHRISFVWSISYHIYHISTIGMPIKLTMNNKYKICFNRFYKR